MPRRTPASMFPKRVTARRYRCSSPTGVNQPDLRTSQASGYRRCMRLPVRVVTAATALGLFISSAPGVQAADLPVPVEVTSALATFGQDPQGAMTGWAAWAANAPMTYVRKGKRPKTRSNCRIDAAGVADCNDFAQVIGRGNRNMGMKKISEIITAGKRQFFRDPPLKRWTNTRTASDPNPITGIADRIGFDPWRPWNDAAPGIATQILENGTMEVSAQNPALSEGEPARTVTRISANGLQATVLEYDQQGRISNSTRITLKPVPAVRVPRGR